MNRFKLFTAALAMTAASTAVAAAVDTSPVSALYNCTTIINHTGTDYGSSKCNSISPSGENLQRADVLCYSDHYYHRYGTWKGVGQWSFGYCDTYDTAITVYIQYR